MKRTDKAPPIVRGGVALPRAVAEDVNRAPSG
jgi:hypothetical protein